MGGHICSICYIDLNKHPYYTDKKIKPISEKLIPYPINNTYELWLSITTHNSLYIGSWKQNGEMTVYTLLHLDNLNQLNNIGFSSFAHANWEVQNVGPAAAIAGSMIDMITVSCERNL